MKQIVALLAMLCMATEVDAQESQEVYTPRSRTERVAARVERHRVGVKENNVFLTFAIGRSSYNQRLSMFKLEYSRQIKGNFYWGATFAAGVHEMSAFTYDWDGQGPYPYRNTANQDIYKLSGMGYYRIPVIKSRLYFRLGAGVGVGYHHIRELGDLNDKQDAVLPYFTFEGAWILRVSKSFEMKFSPTIVWVPSEISVSPIQLGAPSDVTPWVSDIGFSLTLGWRF